MDLTVRPFNLRRFLSGQQILRKWRPRDELISHRGHKNVPDVYKFNSTGTTTAKEKNTAE